MNDLKVQEKANDASYILEMMAFKYHEVSKLSEYNHRELGLNIEKIKEDGLTKKMMKSYKIYSGAKQIELPKSNLTEPLDLQSLIVKRRSKRNFRLDIPLKLEEAAQILQLSYGATAEFTYQNQTQLLRATPSAGALYPLELYMLARNVTGIDLGVYHYRVCHHSLEFVKSLNEEFYKLLEDKWYFPKGFQSIFLITGVWNRTFIKYLERAYRFLLIEAGIVGENMTLIAEAQNLNALMMGGWSDDEFNEMLGIDGINEVSLLPICVGVCENG